MPSMTFRLLGSLDELLEIVMRKIRIIGVPLASVRVDVATTGGICLRYLVVQSES